MSAPRSPSCTKTPIRCESPDCDRGTPASSFDARHLSRCRREFRKHCIERHRLDPNDTERICWFDLEAFTLTIRSLANSEPRLRPIIA
jgi:hypothetical protein